MYLQIRHLKCMKEFPVTHTCSLAECGPLEAGCQSRPTSYRSLLDSSLTRTSTPLSVQWHLVETPLTDREQISMLSATFCRSPLQIPPSPPSHVVQRSELGGRHLACLLPRHHHQKPRGVVSPPPLLYDLLHHGRSTTGRQTYNH